MIERRIVLSEQAIADVRAIRLWLSREASPIVANRFVRRIKSRLGDLAHGSERGSLRSDVAKGLRVIGLMGSVTVAFRVVADRVEVLRILYGGQDWQAALTTEDDD